MRIRLRNLCSLHGERLLQTLLRIHQCDVEAVKSILEHGVPPTVLNHALQKATVSIGDQSQTIVHNTQENKFKICCVLLDHGARIMEREFCDSISPNATEQNTMLLHYCCYYNNMDTLHRLLSLTPQYQLRSLLHGMSTIGGVTLKPLSFAVQEGNSECIKEVLSHYTNTLLQLELDHETFIAVEYGRHEILKILLEYKSSHIRDSSSFLFAALAKNDYCSSDILIQYGAQVSEAVLATEEEQIWETVIEQAVAHSNWSIRSLLLTVVERRNLKWLGFLTRQHCSSRQNRKGVDVSATTGPYLSIEYFAEALQKATAQFENCKPEDVPLQFEICSLLLDAGAAIKESDQSDNQPSLCHYCCKFGNKRALSKMLPSLTNAQLQNTLCTQLDLVSETTPICFAIRNNHSECVELLLKECTERNIQISLKEEIHTVVKIVNFHILTLLVDHVGDRISDSEYSWCLVTAIANGNQKCAALLIEKGIQISLALCTASCEDNVSFILGQAYKYSNKSLDSILFYLVEACDTTHLRLLLQDKFRRFCDLDALHDGETVLVFATLKGNIDAVKLLLGCTVWPPEKLDVALGFSVVKIADLDQEDYSQFALLNQFEICGMLLENGATVPPVTYVHDTNKSTIKTESLLCHYSCIHGNLDLLRKYLAAVSPALAQICLDLAVTIGTVKMNPISFAILHGHDHCTEYLLEYCKEHSVQLQLLSLAAQAASQGKFSILGLFLTYDNALASNIILHQYLSQIVQMGDKTCASLLISYGADVTEPFLSSQDETIWHFIVNTAIANRNMSVRSLLFIASQNGQLECVKFLLKNKYRLKLGLKYTENGETVLMVAAKNGHLHIVMELLKYKMWNDEEQLALQVLLQHNFEPSELTAAIQTIMNQLNSNDSRIVNKKLDICSQLLSAGARTPMQLPRKPSLLHYASFYGNNVLLQRALCATNVETVLSVLNTPSRIKGTRLRPLDMATKNGYSKSCQILLQFCRQHDIELDLSQGVRIASENNELPILKFFFEFEKRIISKHSLTNSLQVALETENMECARMVMEYGIDVCHTIRSTDKEDIWKFVLENSNNYCNSDLHELILDLVDNRKNKCLQFILSHQRQFDLNEYHTGQIALNKSLLKNNYAFTEVLLKYDIDVNSTEANHILPLFQAIRFDSDDTIFMKLIQYGCDVNLREPSKPEDTAVACAYTRKQPLFLRMLHLAGADFTSIVTRDLSQQENVSELLIQTENVVYEALTIPHDLQNLARIVIRFSIGINVPRKVKELQEELPSLLIEYLQLPELTNVRYFR